MTHGSTRRAAKHLGRRRWRRAAGEAGVEVVEGRTAAKLSAWLDDQPEDWRAGIRSGVLDRSGPYQAKLLSLLEAGDPRR